MKQREIWLIKYPGRNIGHEYKKERPAIIIQSDKQIQKSNVYTVVPFTSNLSNRVSDDILVKEDDENGLYKDSLLKMHHIQTFDQARFMKYIGVIKKDIIEQVKDYLRIHFDL